MTETLQRNVFSLSIEDLAPAKFWVQSWEGVDGLNQCYRYSMRVLSNRGDLAVDNEALGCLARFCIDPGDGHPELIRWGIVDVIEDLGQNADGIHHWYLFEIVPRLYDLQYSFHSRSWVKQSQDNEQISSGYTTVNLLQDFLREHDLQGDAVRWDLEPNDYPERDFIVQYEESDFDFLSRWLEYEGISYYFIHDEHQEVLVFCDKSSAFPDLAEHIKTLPVLSGSGAQNENLNAIWNIQQSEKLTPDQSRNRDWNWRTPEQVLEQAYAINEQALGTGPWEALGEHYKNTLDGDRLARIRAEMHQAWQHVVNLESTCRYMQAGHALLIEGSSLLSQSGERQVIVKTELKGSQAILEQGDDAGSTFEAHCEVLDSRYAIRPRLQHPWPQVPGVIQGRIEAVPGGSVRHDGASVDEDGRYFVRLCFDQRNEDNQQSSRPIRMMQPNMGPNTGMHWLLPPGTEVLVGFTDGNPDRPIIIGSVPHGEDTAPVLAQNSSEQVMRTTAGHFSINDDNADNPVQSSGDGSGNNMEMSGKGIFKRLAKFREAASSSDFSATNNFKDMAALASSAFSNTDESTKLDDPNEAFWTQWNANPPNRCSEDIKMHSVNFEAAAKLETGADGDTGDIQKELNTLGKDVTAKDKINAAWVGFKEDYDKATWDGDASPFNSPDFGVDDARSIRIQNNHLEVVSDDQIDLQYGTAYTQYWADVINRDGGHTWNIYKKSTTNQFNIFNGGGVVVGGGSEYKYTRAYDEFNGIDDRFEMCEVDEQKDMAYNSLNVELRIGILDVALDNRVKTVAIDAGPEFGIEVNIRGVSAEFCTFETDIELAHEEDDDNAKAMEIDLGIGSFSLVGTIIEKDAQFVGLMDLDMGLIRIQNTGTVKVIEAVAVTIKNTPIAKTTNTRKNRISLLAFTKGILFKP